MPRLREGDDVTPISWFQQIVVSQIVAKPQMYAFLHFTGVLLEVLACLSYFVSLEANDVSAEEYTFFHLHMQRGLVVVNGILGVCFILQFIFVFLSAPHYLDSILSLECFLLLTTAIPMASLLVVDRCVSHGDVFWIPFFLRVWIARKYARTLITLTSALSPATAEIISHAILSIAIIVTSLGVFQIVETVGKNDVFEFYNSLYFIVVTVTTMGYGDIRPTSRVSYATVMVIIFVSMLFFPALLSNVSELIDFLTTHNVYRNSADHVLICGTFTYTDFRLLLREFTAGVRKFSDLNLVIVSPEPFDPRVQRMVKTSVLRKRVTLCVGDVLDRKEIVRFAARRADCVILLSPHTATSQRGDFKTLLSSVAFQRHDPDLPQYLMLKRVTESTLVQRCAFVVFDREKLKYTLIGMALKLPAVIPWLLNLIKTSNVSSGAFDADQEIGWWSEYNRGVGNSIFCMRAPEPLEGRLFSAASHLLMCNGSVTLIGIVRDGHVLINPSDKLKSSDVLLVLACGARNVEHCAAKCETLDRLAPTGSASESSYSRALDPAVSGLATSSYGAFLRKGGKRKKCWYPFEDHILLIDLCGTLSEQELCLEERLSEERFQVVDLLRLLRPFVHDDQCNENIVLMSTKGVSELIAQQWSMSPIFFVKASGLDGAALDKCSPGKAKAVLIFCSLEGTLNNSDTLVRLVLSMVKGRLKACGRDKSVPVVVDLQDATGLNYCEPLVRGHGRVR